MITELQQEGTYHTGIAKLLRAAYLRDFNMQEMGRCKRKFPAFKNWYKALNAKQLKRVDAYLNKIYDRYVINTGC